MTDETANLIIEHLKGLRSEQASLRSEMHEQFNDLKARMSNLESAMVAVRRDVNLHDEVDARQQVSLDSIVRRIERIERRLDLADAP